MIGVLIDGRVYHPADVTLMYHADDADSVDAPMTPEQLISEVRAALDEREAHAQKDIWAADQATQGNWRARYGVNLPHSWVETESIPVARLDGARHEADGLLIARFKPANVRERAAAVLRLVAGQRRILDEHSPHRNGACPVCWRVTARSSIREDYPCPTLTALAHGLGINPEEETPK